MRVMVLIKATPSSEAGLMPNEELMTAMGEYNKALHEAGILRDGDGLKPTSFGKRVRFANGGLDISEGPFPLHEKPLAGFWIWEVSSIEEAVSWIRRCPHPMPGEEAEIDLRPCYGPEDFGDAMSPELHAQEEAVRIAVEKLRAS